MANTVNRVDSGIAGLTISTKIERVDRVDSGIADVSDSATKETGEPLTRVDSAVQGLSPMGEPLTKVDSAVQGLSISPAKETGEPLTRVDSAVQGLSPTEETGEPLTKVDSAVQGLSTSPPKEKKASKEKKPLKEKVAHRRTSSSTPTLPNMQELKQKKTRIQVAIETQGTGWKINTSTSHVDDKDILSKPLVTPLVKSIDLHFSTGIVVTARNKAGVTIKDALEVIYKKNKNKADDELSEPYLKGFVWEPDSFEGDSSSDVPKQYLDEWDRLYISLSQIPTVATSRSGGKKKKKAAAEAE
ncbi:hypothetical protein GGS23DRAFT_600576 [Durotheca rogersii]|uniref:uncharacterized protein n=1 Tax=Durotheca rogersii TaxID=419775 RepID=UPI00221EABC7|nr:uncharacterized protein GGS23DRAFT_600576 [Durotheca rogersii]KAI5859288.1 hypothetical protein GGS23DRAFT_600576 [Durotheca rogersii]